jgi:hypothetical protein
MRIDFPLKRRVVGKDRDPLLHGLAGDRLRHVLRGAGVARAALRDPGDQLVRFRVEQEDRHAVDVHDLEREVDHLVEQAVELLLLRQLLRHFEQQRELLFAALFQSLCFDFEVRRPAGLRLVDDDRRHAPAHRQLAHDRATGDRRPGVREVRRRRDDLRPWGRGRHFLHSESHFPEGDDVIGARFGLGDLGAVQERAVRGAEVLHQDAILAE